MSPPPQHQALSCRARAGLGHLSGLADPGQIARLPSLELPAPPSAPWQLPASARRQSPGSGRWHWGPDHRGMLSPASSQIPRSSPWRGPPTGSRAPRHGVVRLGSGGGLRLRIGSLHPGTPAQVCREKGGGHAVGLAVLIARLRALRRPSRPRWLAVFDLPIPGNSVVRSGPSPSRSLSRARASEASEDTGEPRTPRGASATSPPPGTVFREAVTP